jgi:hypothetical protein
MAKVLDKGRELISLAMFVLGVLCLLLGLFSSHAWLIFAGFMLLYWFDRI